MNELWHDLLLPKNEEDLAWELFHENSKRGRYDNGLSNEQIFQEMRELHESLPFEGHPVIKLPRSLVPLKVSLDEAIMSRSSNYDMMPSVLTLKQLTTLLHYAYGINRDNKDTNLPRSFRFVPSAGALYPLELFFYGDQIEGLDSGIYHYNPSNNHLRLLRGGDQTAKLFESMVQSEIAHHTRLIIFITAIFERSIFKYGDRGYRFVLLEAGHVAQNINLVANALGLGSLNIGGYFDREIDQFLELDGVTHSTIYLIAVGKPKQSKTT